MKSHAKASTAGSNSGGGASLSPIRRALATLASSGSSDGIGAPLGRRLALLTAAAATFLLLSAAQASAATVTVQAAPGSTGTGTVTGGNPGDPLNCHVVGTLVSGQCTTTQSAFFEELEFTASGEGGSTFVEWEWEGTPESPSCKEEPTNNPCSGGFFQGEGGILRAKFAGATPTVTVQAAPGSTGTGTVTGGNPGDPLNCHVVGTLVSGQCTTTQSAFFEELEFTASGEGGSTFVEWEWEGTPESPSCKEEPTNNPCSGGFFQGEGGILRANFAAATATVVTEAASGVGVLGATLNGKVNPNSIAVEECEFQYVTEAAFQSTGFSDLSSGGTSACVPDPGSGSAFVPVSASLSGLTPGTAYRFRLIASNTNGTGEGSDLGFTTKPAVKDVTTNPATNVGPYSATLNGSLDPDGSPISDCHFEYVTHEAFLATGFANLSSGGSSGCVPPPGSGSGAISVSANVSGLHGGGAYDFRLVATNANGTTAGSNQGFTTDPIAFTDPATTIHHTSVVLNGHFDPSGDAGIVNCQFDWGTDTTYSGGTVPCGEGDSFAAPASVTATLGGLTPGTTYHFRLHVTTTSHGGSTGNDQSFTPDPFPLNPPEELAAFGPDGTESSSFGSIDGFKRGPSALAFAYATHRLYAGDRSVPGVYGFDAASPPTFTPLSAFGPLATVFPGSSHGLAVDNTGLSSAGNVYYSSYPNAAGATGLVYGFDSNGTALGGNFPIDTDANPGGSPHAPWGLAVDSSGGLWVSNLETKHILHYSSAGVFQGSIDVSSLTPEGVPFAIAFDSNDDLYVDIGARAVWKLTAASGYSPASAINLLSNASRFVELAVDTSSGDFYIIDSEIEFSRIRAYDSSGQHLYDFAEGSPGSFSIAITVDSTSHDIYVADIESHKVRVFSPGAVQRQPTLTPGDPTAITGTSAILNAKVDPEGIEVTDCHFEWGTSASYGNTAPCSPDPGLGSGDVAAHADLSGLKGGTTYHFRIVASNDEGFTASGPDQSFATGGPRIGAQSVESVGISDATVSAQINPAGEATTYHVEYGTTSAYGQTTSESAPFGIAGDESPHTVSVHVGGLKAGTGYHFRFVASSAGGTGEGADATLATYPPSVPSFAPCPNDAFRTGFGANLPDCRAYEQATPIDKHGANIQGTIDKIQASSAGDRIDFLLNGGLASTGGSSSLAPFLASRGPGGWSSDGLLPPTESGASAGVRGWSEDMSTVFGTTPAPGGRAFFLRDSATGAFQQSGPTFPELLSPYLAGFAADTSHLIFENQGALAPGAIAGKDNLYDLDHGDLTLAGRIPAGSATSCDDAGGPACVPAPEGSFAGPYDLDAGNLAQGGAARDYYTDNTISRDGSKVFFTAAGTGRLYVREDSTKTTRVSASQRTVPDPNGEKPAAFMAATPDGSKVFFTSCEKLTDDSTAFSTAANSCTESDSGLKPGSDLYSYDTETGELTDLTVDPNGDPKGADVAGVLGVSNDGSYVYFAASGALASSVSLANCRSGITCNLYVSRNGSVAFIASLSVSGLGDAENWRQQAFATNPRPKISRVSADGSAILFRSKTSLTGYDNAGKTEFFLYTAPEEELTCVSCNPTGLPPGGDATLVTNHNFVIVIAQHFLTRNLSSDGNRAFFESPDALLPSDTNGVTDVYEWEAKGTGSCETESQNGGCLYLISSGRSPDPTYFGDASANGDHVFLFTSQQLVPGDEDELIDIYDAGVAAGLAAQHALAPPTCTGTACQANPAPPPDPTMSSSSFQGLGNTRLRPAARKCPKGKRKVRSAGKVKCQKASKQHKRHSNRGGSK